MYSISKILGKEVIYKNKLITIDKNSIIINKKERIDAFPSLIPQRITFENGEPVIIFKLK